MKRSRAVAAIAAAAIVVAGCAGSAGSQAAPYGARGPIGAATMAPNAQPATGGQGNGNGSNAGPETTSGPQSPSGPAASGGIPENITRPEDAIVKIGLIQVQVTDLDGSIIKATDMIHSFGGYLAGSQRSSSTTGGVASVTFRVPVARFEDALGDARKLGSKVLGEHIETTPVGSQIVDLQARIDNLKTSEKAIQTIMARASSIPDVLTVEGRLSDVQGQIEQLNAQLTGLTDQATYSTLTIEFDVPNTAASPSPSPTPLAAAGWNVNNELDQASTALVGIGQGVATVGIWLIVVVIPVGVGLLVLLVIGLVGLRLGRRLIPAIRREVALEAAGEHPDA